MRERGLSAAVVLLLVAGIVAAGVRAGDDGADPAQVVFAAADTALAASSGQVEMHFSMEASGLPVPMGDVTMRLTGAFDHDRQLIEVSGDGPIGIRMHVVQHGPTHYYRIAGPSGDDLGGWVRIDTEGELAEERTVALAGAQDPTDVLAMLRDVGDVEHLGTDRIDGREFQHYRAVADPDRLLDQQELTMTPDEEAFLRDSTRSAVLQVWLGPSGLPGRIAMAMEFETADHGRMRMDVQMDFRNWNEPVDITVPPDDAVIEHHRASTHVEFSRITGELHMRAFASP